MDVVLLTSGPDVDNISIYRTLGAYKIAHSCREAGYSVQVIDHIVHFTKDELLKCLCKYVDNNTHVLGISTTFMVSYGHVSQHIKESLIEIQALFPNLKIILGGYSTHFAKRNPDIKVHSVIVEYGEDIFVDVLDCLIRGKQEPSYTIEFVSKANYYKVYSKPITVRFNIETDNFKFVDDDVILPNEALPIEISRGCIFKCKFCNHLMLGRGKLDYLKDIELIKEQMLYNHSKWGTDKYYIICDTFNDTEYKMKLWHSMVASLPFKIKYTSYLRADLLHRNPDVPYMLQESGLYSCFHGIESFNEEGAMSIGKGWSAKSGKEYLPELYHNIWKDKIHQTLSFIIGLPGDTRESSMEIAKWFNDNDMYHVTLHSLGLTSDKSVKNLSEFDRNTEKYGYKFQFDPVQKRKYWFNDYWGQQEVDEFVEKQLLPAMHQNNARHGSWQIIQLLQLGVPEEMFLKESKNKFIKEDLKILIKNQVQLYIKKLLEK